ncbi:MAG: NADH-quinone oxidoreductase subunit N [Pirellulales bacterium]|nr:NADH-quinone oxidoreductase subunit N [Pirellulales bacterium]
MSLTDFVNSLIENTQVVSIPLFRPELILCVTVVVMLLVQVLLPLLKGESFWIAVIGCGLALSQSLPWNGIENRVEIFNGMLVFDAFTVYFRAFLLLFALLLLVLTYLTEIPDRDDDSDFYTLVLGATLGMCLMASANHLLMVFLGVEMASVPSYALAGLLKGRRKASEAALKYAVYGAGAAGIMLYGISLLAGVLGSVHIPTMANNLAVLLSSENASQAYLVLILGGLMVMVGLAFKLSAVPFHFWCPDVFDGACAEVNAFLSIASKGAALALLIRVAVGFGYGADQPLLVKPTSPTPASAQNPTPHNSASGQTVNSGQPASTARILPAAVENAAHTTAAPTPPATGVAQSAATVAATPVLASADRVAALAPVRTFIMWVVGVMAMVTCTFGNLAAYSQTNIKRLLAYSTIAHAGYMMMPVAAGMALAGGHPDAAESAISAIPFYLGTYLFTNLTALSIVAFLRNRLGSEQYSAYAGMIRVSPGVTVCLTLALISLIGLPPVAGFVGKLMIFWSLVQAATLVPASTSLMIALLVVAGLNTAISLYYYLRVIKIMTIDPLPADRPMPQFSLVSLGGIYIVAVTVPIVVLGIFFDSFLQLTQTISAQLLG